jgi:predicted membrane protein
MQHEKKVMRLYHRELFCAFAVYAVLLFSAIHFGRPMAEGALRTLILVLPMIGFGLMIWSIARHVRRIDEYRRQSMLETFAIAAAITAAATFSYGFLETAGFPRLSMFTVWPVMGASWMLVAVARALLNR